MNIVCKAIEVKMKCQTGRRMHLYSEPPRSKREEQRKIDSIPGKMNK